MDKFQGMNRFLAEKLRAPTMTANDAPDGGDRQLADAAAALAEEATDEAYTPPFPVPLMTPLRRGEGMRGSASEVWLVNPPSTLPGIGGLVAGGNAEKGSQFPINSIRVDNMTSQWLYWPEIGAFVPPFWYGRVLRFTGGLIQRVKFETPTGITALAASATNIARVVFSEDYWPEESGSSIDSVIGTSAGAPPTAVSIVDDTSATFADVVLPVDALANNEGLITASLNYALNSASTYDRLRSQATNADAVAAIAAGALVTAELQFGFNGTTWDRMRTPNIFKNLAGVAIGAGSTATVWTPAAGKKPRLMGWVISGSSSLAADSPVQFFETNTSGTFMGNTGELQGAIAPVVSPPNIGNGVIVSTSSAVIVAFASTATTLFGMLFGTEE